MPPRLPPLTPCRRRRFVPVACRPQYRSGTVAGTPCKFTPKNLNATLCTHVNYAFAFMNEGRRRRPPPCMEPCAPRGAGPGRALAAPPALHAPPLPLPAADFSLKPVEWNDEDVLYPETMALRKQVRLVAPRLLLPCCFAACETLGAGRGMRGGAVLHGRLRRRLW